MTAVWDRSKQTGTALLILLALADFTNDDGYCWPSIDTLAHKARCSRRHVQRLLKDISHGEGKEVEIRENAGPNGVHLYRITLPVAPRRPLDATTVERGDILSPGVTSEASEGDILAGGGDIQSPQMSPKPSLTIKGSVTEPSGGTSPTTAPFVREGEHLFASLVKAWEDSCGPITAGIAEDLADLAEEAGRHASALPSGAAGEDLPGEAWVIAAIGEARRSSDGRRPNVRFVQSILDRWRVDGFQAPRPLSRPARPERPSAVDAWLEEKQHGQ